MMSYVLDGQCDTGSGLPSDKCGEVNECICGVSHSPAMVRFHAATVFSIGGCDIISRGIQLV